MKWALITGASGGIGKSLVNKLADDNWNLYLQGFNHMNIIYKLIKMLNEKYPKQEFIPIKANLLSDFDIKKMLNNIFQVDAFIHAAGITYYSLLTDQNSDEWDNLWKIHIKAPLIICKNIQKKLSRSHNGRIILLGSVYGKIGSAMEVVYSTVKGAQSSFVNAYSKEIISLGITINSIAPGAVDTDMNNFFSKREIQRLKNQIPISRMADPNEITYWIECILSEKSKYLTGQTIYVDGGWLY